MILTLLTFTSIFVDVQGMEKKRSCLSLKLRAIELVQTLPEFETIISQAKQNRTLPLELIELLEKKDLLTAYKQITHQPSSTPTLQVNAARLANITERLLYLLDIYCASSNHTPTNAMQDAYFYAHKQLFPINSDHVPKQLQNIYDGLRKIAQYSSPGFFLPKPSEQLSFTDIELNRTTLSLYLTMLRQYSQHPQDATIDVIIQDKTLIELLLYHQNKTQQFQHSTKSLCLLLLKKAIQQQSLTFDDIESFIQEYLPRYFSTDDSHNSLLEIAVAYQNKNVSTQLSQHICMLASGEEKRLYLSAWQQALLNGDLELVKAMIAQNQKMITETKLLTERTFTIFEIEKVTSLMLAARSGNIHLAKHLLDLGIPLEAQCIMGSTTLSWAVAAKDLQMVKFLISKGADFNHRNIYGKTAEESAREAGNLEIANYLNQVRTGQQSL